MTDNMEHAEVLKGFSVPIFISKKCIQEQKAPEMIGKVWSKEDFLTLSEKGHQGVLKLTGYKLEVVKSLFKKILKI